MDGNVRFTDYLLVKTKLPELEYLKLLRSAAYNRYDIALVKAGAKRSALVRFRDGSALDIGKETFNKFQNNTKVQIALFKSTAKDHRISIGKNSVEFFYNSHKVRLNYSRAVPDVFAVLREVFTHERYSLLEVRGKTVIDIGGYIGETAIYFSLNGARHVYVFEPDARRCVLARRNIEMNGLGDRITLVQKSVCGSNSSRSTTLEGILHSYGLKSAVLKADCEGCEYPLLLAERSDAINALEQIQLEYHSGYLNLERRLKALGFDVIHTMPNKMQAGFFGHLYARKA
jgi:predicted RNA methylase